MKIAKANKYIIITQLLFIVACSILQTKYDIIDTGSGKELNIFDRKNAISFVETPLIDLSMVMSFETSMFSVLIKTERLNTGKESSNINYLDNDDLKMFNADDKSIIKAGEAFYSSKKYDESRNHYLKALKNVEDNHNNDTSNDLCEKISILRWKIVTTYQPGSLKRKNYAIDSANAVSGIIGNNNNGRAWMMVGLFQFEGENVIDAHRAYEKAYRINENEFEPFFMYNLSSIFIFFNKLKSDKNLLHDIRSKAYVETIRNVLNYDSIIKKAEQYPYDMRYKLLKTFCELYYVFAKGAICMGDSFIWWPDDNCDGDDEYDIEQDDTNYPPCLCYKSKDKEVVDNAIKSLESIESAKIIKESILFNWLGIAYHLKQEREKAKYYFIKAFNADPGDSKNIDPLLIYDFRSKNQDSNLQLIDKKISQSPSMFDYLIKSIILTSIDKFGQAADAARKAAEMNPDDFDVNLALSAAYIKSNELDKAEMAIQKCLLFHNKNLEIRRSLAFLFGPVSNDGKVPFPKIKENYPKALLNSGIIKLLKNNPKGAFDDFIWGLHYCSITKAGSSNILRILDRFYHDGSKKALDILYNNK